MRIDQGALLLVAVVGGCAYVEDRQAARHHFTGQAEPGGPALPAAAPGRLRPLGVNFALFPEPGDEMAALYQEVILIRQGDEVSAGRFVAADHLEVTFSPDADDFGGERAIRIDLPDGARDKVEVLSDRCFDFRPAQDSHGCTVVLRTGTRLPPGPYKITMTYAAEAERSLGFTVVDAG